MKFKKHPDETMGIVVVVDTDKKSLWFGVEREWAFPLGDDEQSNAYRAWLAQQSE